MSSSAINGDWWVALDGKADGPHEEEYLAYLVAQGRISQATLVWKGGMNDCVHAHQA